MSLLGISRLASLYILIYTTKLSATKVPWSNMPEHNPCVVTAPAKSGRRLGFRNLLSGSGDFCPFFSFFEFYMRLPVDVRFISGLMYLPANNVKFIYTGITHILVLGARFSHYFHVFTFSESPSRHSLATKIFNNTYY